MQLLWQLLIFFSWSSQWHFQMNPQAAISCLGKPGFSLNVFEGQTNYSPDQLMLAEHIWQVATRWDQRLQACFPVKFQKPSSAGTLSPAQSSLANTAGCRQPSWLKWIELFNYWGSPAFPLNDQDKAFVSEASVVITELPGKEKLPWKDNSQKLLPLPHKTLCLSPGGTWLRQKIFGGRNLSC